MKITVFLADDHVVLRDGLRALLEAEGDIEVVGEAGNGREAVEAIRRLQPAVALLDISMPELGGIEAAEILNERCPGIKVVMLSVVSDAENVYRALRAGAQGYVLKSSAGREVVQAVRTVHQGRRYLGERLADVMVDLVGRDAKAGPLASLSRRERQILQLLVDGRSAPEIGRQLSISPRTVETYRARLMEKLRVKDLRELLLFAVKHGLVRTE